MIYGKWSWCLALYPFQLQLPTIILSGINIQQYKFKSAIGQVTWGDGRGEHASHGFWTFDKVQQVKLKMKVSLYGKNQYPIR